MAELTVTALRVVQAVVATGSFTATADLLGYTQSAVSRQVAAAEAAAGATLFVRGARGVAPTPAGERVARRAAAALAEIDAVPTDLARLADRLAGRVVLGAFPTATWVLVPCAVGVLRQRHPGLTVDLREASTPAQLRQLRAGRLDVAVVAVGADLPAYDLDGLRTDHLVDGRSLLAVARGHRFAGWEQVPVAELADEDWVVGTGLSGDPQFGAWPTLPAPRVAYSAREWHARLGLVAAGLGITTLPEIAAAAVPAGVVTVPVDDPAWLGRAAVAVTRPERAPGAAAVVAVLRELARALG
ncbi:LysR family transcriptional regulator [Promicromonospora thailandica]|uniref:DNA-binding transcriptional regulator, LysR family n=1 Tax=Promicromonospora thailandica TaxID=765201 RepID=A0A9X2JVH2_9MICO|nr:LysR family transcriptional regulator [Promicromonospora thailandica]MCP2264093.1 DNA-binding transcriptional regulator, LysR family [Promicromonospora thailandica]BFF21249.1 LysR family transcriptional regulator [Promicromonospora thailandica]